MRKYLTILLFFLFQFILCQEITISVKDTNGKIAEDVNVQLLKNNKTQQFKTTNEEGICSFSVPESGKYTVKFTSMLFKTKYFEINTSEKTVYEIVLESQITEIREVEIKARPKIATYRKDTISYNLKAIRNGTERTTEDLIKKLPGLDVDENGKISNNGKMVGQVLVEGNELFGKNHKLATQNISADMIEGIDFWQNYTTISGNKSTAINLKLKSEYKNKITGNANINYGNNNSFLAHTNLFKINKKGNLAFIGDANSIAKDPIGIWDFYEMNKMDEIENANSGSIQLNTPSFLNNDGKVESKKNWFGALQYSKTNQNFSLTAFSIINAADIQKLTTNIRNVFMGQPSSYNYYEARNENNKGFFGTTQLKMRKNFSPNSYIYYNFVYNPTEDNFNQNIDLQTVSNTDFIQNKNKINNYSFGNLLSWTKNFDNTQFIAAFSQQKNNENTNLNLASTQDLFLTPTHKLAQSLQNNSDKYSFNLFLKNNFDFGRINFQSGYNNQNQQATLSELYSQNLENKNLQTHHFVNEIYISKNIWLLDVSGRLRSNFLYFNQNEKHYLEKSFSIKYQPKTSAANSFSLEYNNKFKSPDFLQLLQSKLYNRNLQYSQNFGLTPETLVENNSFSFTYHRFDFSKGNHLLLLLTYEKSNENFTSNITNFGKFSQSLNILGDWRDYFLFLISEDRKINTFLTLKSKLTGYKTRANNLVQDQPNEMDFKNLLLSQQLSSNFKKIPFQFEFGYSYNKSFSEQSLFNTKSNQQTIKLNLAIKTSYRKEWLGNILGEYLIQKSPQVTVQNFLFGGQISYKKQNTNLEYNILFNNILNFNNFKYINSSVGLLGTDQTTVYALPGYITGGLKYNF